MSFKLTGVVSDGVASIIGGNVQTFDFSAAGTNFKANYIRIAASSGGPVRVNVDGANPASVITSIDVDEFWLYADGGESEIALTKEFTEVRLRPVANVSNLVITVGTTLPEGTGSRDR